MRPLSDENPRYFRANFQLGLAYAHLNRRDEALLYLQRAARIREAHKIPDYEVYNALGWLRMGVEDYRLAERHFLQGVAHERDNPPALNRKLFTNLGLLYYTLRQIGPAKHYLSIASERYRSETAADTLELVRKLEQKRWELIGQRIWLNEGGGRRENLTHWGEGEDHASMGVGHFIWYPRGEDGPFQETFPDLLRYLESKEVELPRWLAEDRDCPWRTREVFLADRDSPKMEALRELLESTVPHQVEFLSIRLQNALPKIVATLSPDEAARVERQYERVATTRSGEASPAGIYALLDYVHFKGEGIDPEERYRGEGWGLLQVLQAMSGETDNPRREFAEAAETVLRRRIANAPRDESRWLEGWKNRLETYTETYLE